MRMKHWKRRITRETVAKLTESDLNDIDIDIDMSLNLLHSVMKLQEYESCRKGLHLIGTTWYGIAEKLRGEDHESIKETADH